MTVEMDPENIMPTIATLTVQEYLDGMVNETNASDEDIARLVQQGDVAAFAELVRRYQAKLLRYGSRFLRGSEEVEDVVQEVLLKAYRNIKSFNAQQRFSPWIYRIAHNAFIDVLKAKRIEPVPFFNPDELFPHPVSPENPSNDAQRSIIKQQLDACLDELEAKYREPLVLRYYEDLSYQEIGRILRLPVGTVSVRLKRGLAKLQERFESHQYHV